MHGKTYEREGVRHPPERGAPGKTKEIIWKMGGCGTRFLPNRDADTNLPAPLSDIREFFIRMKDESEHFFQSWLLKRGQNSFTTALNGLRLRTKTKLSSLYIFHVGGFYWFPSSHAELHIFGCSRSYRSMMKLLPLNI